MHYRARAGFNNTAPSILIGRGAAEGSFQIERIIEKTARELGFDPIELRRQNIMSKGSLPLRQPWASMLIAVISRPSLKTLAMSDRAASLRVRQEVRSSRKAAFRHRPT